MSEALGGDQAGRFRQFLLSDQSRANIGNRLATNRATGRLLAIAGARTRRRVPLRKTRAKTPRRMSPLSNAQEAR